MRARHKERNKETEKTQTDRNSASGQIYGLEEVKEKTANRGVADGAMLFLNIETGKHLKVANVRGRSSGSGYASTIRVHGENE